ncbi:MAG: MFS transporter [Chloroflexota bacterium]|nr:MFS transporter [Chloroflexota bacterium]MDE2959318.1 MFS transporter [Chloroflexota bacterium]
MAFSPAALIPQWVRTYAVVVLAVSLAVNLITSFSLYVQALTIPGMKSAFELSYTTVFVLVVALSISRVVSGLLSGAAASRYGGRWMVISSIFVQAVAMGLLGWAPSYWIALAAMIAVGVSSGAALTPMMGMLAPWFRVNDRGVAAGIAASGGSLAIVFTGVIVPPLTGAFGDEAWRYTWYVLAASSVLIGLACVSFIREAPTAESPSGSESVTGTTRSRTGARRGPAGWPVQVYTNPYVWLITGMAFCSGFVHGILTVSYGAYLGVERGIDVAVVGALFMLIGVLSIGSGVASGALSDRIGRGLAFSATFLIEVACHGMFWLAPDLVYFVIASVLAGFALRSTYTICAAAAGDFVPVYMAPAAFGLMGMGAGIGGTISPAISGPIADATGTLRWSFAMASGAAVIGAGLGFTLHMMTRSRDQDATGRAASPA